jgi:hypothetical protein
MKCRAVEPISKLKIFPVLPDITDLLYIQETLNLNSDLEARYLDHKHQKVSGLHSYERFRQQFRGTCCLHV